MKTFLTVLGTRPEIVKFSPLLPRLDRHFRHVLVHTGQHYDENMDRIFFRELRLRAPKYFLNVGSGGQGGQTAKMLDRLEPIMMRVKPDKVLVLGDTNSTLAGALVAAKLQIPIGHIESGCRSLNRAMPEEINRVVVDHLSTLLFAPDLVAVRHLRREGIFGKRVCLVGNTGLDATRRTMRLAGVDRLKRWGARPESYAVATLHRAENTDDLSRFFRLVDALNRVSRRVPVFFPIHPRTAAVLKRHKVKLNPSVQSLPPLGSLDFISLLRSSLFVMSDSGGIQEEAAVVNRPCLILREDTEWTRLVDAGKNFLVGTRVSDILRAASRLLDYPNFRQRVAAKKSPLMFGATDRIMKRLSRRP